MTESQFRQCLAYLRLKVAGKRFEDDPEAFKDIESLKAKFYHAFPTINPHPGDYAHG